MYRWLKRIDNEPNSKQHTWNKTPESLAAFVWRFFHDNIDWGRLRIANQLKILNVFLAASTVSNILQRAQGEHKLARGYLSTPTYSAHWIADDRFRDAVEKYLQSERQHIQQEIYWLNDHSPFRKA